MKKIIITHKDLDGVVSAMIIKSVFGKDIEEIHHITYNNLYENFNNIFNKIDSNTFLTITDISIDGENFCKLKNKILDLRKRILWIDHHTTNQAIHLVNSKVYDLNKSASKLTYELLEKMSFQSKIKHLKKLMIYANDYDLWIHKYRKSYVMSDLYYYYWPKKFMKRFETGDCKLKKFEINYILKLDKRRQKLWEEVQKNTMVNKNEYGKFYVSLLEKYSDINFVSEKFKKNNKDNCSFIILVFSVNKISIRALKDNVNLLELLKDFKVGGHPQACGLVVNLTNKKDKFIRKFLTT